MFTRHFLHWPSGVPRSLRIPRTSVYYNLEVSATRYPESAVIDYYGSRISYAQMKREVDALAGFLQRRCGVAKGDRVLLYCQNGPHFMLGYYAILRADAVEVLEPAKERVQPPCPYAGPGLCGGCDWQHVTPGGQRKLKAQVLTEQLRKLAGLTPEEAGWDGSVEPAPGDLALERLISIVHPENRASQRVAEKQTLALLREG